MGSSFIDNLTLTPTKIHEKVLELVINIITGLFFIISGIYLIISIKKEKNSKSLDEFENKFKSSKITSNYVKILQGIFFIIIAIRLLLFYKPSNSETSLAILIKYLKHKGILEHDIYKYLKQFKPYKMGKYV